LPQVEKFIGFLNETGIPTLNAFIAGLTGDQGLSAGLQESQKSAETFGKGIAGLAGIIKGFISFVREAIGLLVELANQAIRFVNIIKPGADIGYIPAVSRAPAALGQSVPSLPSSANVRENRTTVVNNISVQSLDSEGAARAVQKVLIDSSARSTPTFGGGGMIVFQ
jgi:hypothetical protein